MFFVERKLGMFSGKVLKYPVCGMGIVVFSVMMFSGIRVKAHLTKRFWSRVGSLGLEYLKETNRALVIKEGASNRRQYLEAVRKESLNKSRELTSLEKLLIMNNIKKTNDSGDFLRKVVEREISHGKSESSFYHLLGSRWSNIERAFDDFDGRNADLITKDTQGNKIFVSGVRVPLLERVTIVGNDDSSLTGQRNFFTVTRENRDKINLFNILKEGLRNHSSEQSSEVGFLLVFNGDITKFGSVETKLPGILLNDRDAERKIFRTSSSYEEAIHKIGVNDANNLAGDGTMPDWNPITSKRLQNYAQGKSSENGLIKLHSESNRGKSFFGSSEASSSNEKIKLDKSGLLSSGAEVYRSELNVGLKSEIKIPTNRVVKKLTLNKTK
ncbi:hypothetical protein A6P36_05580 [Candidatus Arthromitus sp. SFB-turkey]|nr:hypothetical protein A6P36_05580 [Candidatus Arthromitus sp. SFB-turkey]